MPLMVNGVQVDINAKNSASPVIKQVAADIGGLETSAKNAGEGVGTANSEMAGFGITARSLGITLGVVTTGISAMVAAFEFGEIASGNQRLADSGVLLAQSYGESLDNIVAKVSEASLGTVSNLDIITSANKAMMLGVGGSADQLAKLMEIAAFRGRAMGISTTQAFDDMVRGIGRMSPMILDNLGIIVDAETTYGNYADSIGKAASELTRDEKIQALLNKVLDEGNRMLEESGGLIEDNATSYERWASELDNAKNSLLENTVEMSRLADIGATLLSTFTSTTKDQNFAEFWFANATGANAYNIALGFLEERVSKQNEVLQNNKNQHWEAMAAYYATTTSVDGLTESFEMSAEATAEALEKLEEYYAGMIDGAISIQKSNDKYKESQDGILEKIQEVRDKKDSYYAWETEKIQAAQDELDELGNKYFENRDKFIAAKQEEFAMMAIEKIAMLDGVEGYSQAEYEKAKAILETADVASAAAFEERQAMDILTSAIASSKDSTIDWGAVFDSVMADGVVTVGEVEAALEKLPKDTDVNINVHTNYTSSGHEQSIPGGPLNGGYAEGTNGWMEVPAGYPNDTYPIRLTSGERFAVIPAGVSAAPASNVGGGMGGGGNQFVYAPVYSGISFGDESDMVSKLYPAFLQMLEQAKAGGHV